MKKIFKHFLIINFFFIIIFGMYSANFSSSEAKEVKEVTPHEIIQIVEKSKNKESLLLTKKENGMLILDDGKTLFVTQIDPNDQEINKLYLEHQIKYKYIKETSLFEGLGNFFEFLLPILFLLFIIRIFMERKKQAGGTDVQQEKKEAESIPIVSFKEVGGLSPDTRKEIQQQIHLFKNREEARKLGIDAPNNLLLYGPPGTGKTLIAKAIAHELRATFYSKSGSDFMEKYVGVGASRIRKLFDEARKNKPSLIFIDEIDAVAGQRGRENRNEEREATLNQLLIELDGTKSNEGVFVVVATNRIDMLDEAFLRSGRFDQKTYIGLPDVEGRKEIIKIHTKNKPLSEEVKNKLDHIAETTYRYSGADIETLFKTAANFALMSNRKEITMEDVNHAIDRMMLGNEGRTLNDEKTKKRVAYHEAGHALITSILKKGGIRKATIVPRGQALGYVAQIPSEMELSTRTDLLDQVKIILAGGVAEIKKFGEHSIGVGGDIEQAKKIIQHMTEIGMNDKSFELTFEDREKQRIMKKIYKEALDSCKELIEKYEEKLDKIAELLLEKETVDGKYIDAIVYDEEIPEDIIEETKEIIEEKIEVKKEISSQIEEVFDGKTAKQGI